MKIVYLTAIFELKIFFFSFLLFICWNMVVISVCIFGVEIIAKFRRERGFLGGPMEPLMY